MIGYFRPKNRPDGFRLADDGLLEKEIRGVDGATEWVVVVPGGRATANMTWRQWCFLQCHVGLLGGHQDSRH